MRYLKASLINFVVIIFIHSLLMGYLLAGDQPPGNCTIGVFDGGVTSDGRPILWKKRDVANSNQRFIYVESYRRDGILTIPYIGNVYSSDSSRVYMGANSEGFAVEQFYIARALFAGFQQENAANVTEIYDFSGSVPDDFRLANYPNPFNGSTRISYILPENRSPILIRIYDSLGRLVKSFTGTEFAENSVIWNGDDSKRNYVKSGIYFYSLLAGPIRLSNKMTLVE